MEFEVDGTGKKFIESQLFDPGSPPIPSREELLEQIARLEREVSELRLENDRLRMGMQFYHVPETTAGMTYALPPQTEIIYSFPYPEPCYTTDNRIPAYLIPGTNITYQHPDSITGFDYSKLGNQVVAE
jgi:hypothetical protein